MTRLLRGYSYRESCGKCGSVFEADYMLARTLSEFIDDWRLNHICTDGKLPTEEPETALELTIDEWFQMIGYGHKLELPNNGGD